MYALLVSALIMYYCLLYYLLLLVGFYCVAHAGFSLSLPAMVSEVLETTTPDLGYF